MTHLFISNFNYLIADLVFLDPNSTLDILNPIIFVKQIDEQAINKTDPKLDTIINMYIYKKIYKQIDNIFISIPYLFAIFISIYCIYIFYKYRDQL